MSIAADAASPERVQHEMTCPTCGAAQVPADECRRCQTDLRMVRAVRREYGELQRRTLAHLRNRRLRRARQSAEQCREISGEESSIRLLAVCQLLQGDFAAALATHAHWMRRSG
jgi:hypothetical protein